MNHRHHPSTRFSPIAIRLLTRRRRRPLPASAVALAFVLALAAVSLALNAAPARPDPCPESELQFDAGAPFSSGAAALDTALSETRRLGFDLRAGTLLMRHDGTDLCCRPTAYVRAHDLFDVVGVPPGTAVSLTVELTVDGLVWTPACGGTGCWGELVAAIVRGADSDVQSASPYSFGGWPPSPVHLNARLPVVLVAGQPALIEFLLSGSQPPGGNHLVTGDGAYRFDGLPAGVAVVSCRGFGAQPTPVRSASWGRLKAGYR